MKLYFALIVLVFLQVRTLEISAQFVYNEYDEVIAFSYIYPKIAKLKKKDGIKTLVLPSYNNDSLFWENNIQYLLPKRGNSRRTLGLARAAGFTIDNIIAILSPLNDRHGIKTRTD